MSKTNALIIKARGLNTQPNELDVPEGSLRVAENVEVTRDNVVQLSPGFADYSSNMPDFEVQALFAYGGTLYAHADDGIWYHDGSNWLRKRARFGAPLSRPYGMILSGSTLYLSDFGKHVIWSIDLTTGARTVLAGRYGTSGATNGTGDAARFNGPAGMTFTGGSLYVCDRTNHVIRKVTTAGVVTTLSGTLGAGSGDVDSGTAANVRFQEPTDIQALGTSLYVCDKTNLKVKTVTTATGASTTLYTTGSANTTPNAITTDGTDLYVCTQSEATPNTFDSEIWKITTGGSKSTITTMAGACNAIYWDSTSSRLLVASQETALVYKVTTAGAATTFIGGGSGTSVDGKASSATAGTVSVCTIGTVNYFAADANTIYISEGTTPGVPALRKMYRSTEYVTTIVGTGVSYGTGANSPTEQIDAMILGPS